MHKPGGAVTTVTAPLFYACLCGSDFMRVCASPERTECTFGGGAAEWLCWVVPESLQERVRSGPNLLIGVGVGWIEQERIRGLLFRASQRQIVYAK